jgi:hypothetical protein
MRDQEGAQCQPHEANSQAPSELQEPAGGGTHQVGLQHSVHGAGAREERAHGRREERQVLLDRHLRHAGHAEKLVGVIANTDFKAR